MQDIKFSVVCVVLQGSICTGLLYTQLYFQGKQATGLLSQSWVWWDSGGKVGGVEDVMMASHCRAN